MRKLFLFVVIALMVNACTPPEQTPPTETVAPPTEVTVPPARTEMPTMDVAPDINAPYCEDLGLEHDPHAWHPHWNAKAGCFWSEFHGDDPNSPEMIEIFGELPYPHFGGPQSTSPVEHEVKHRGDVVFAAAEGDPNWLPDGEESVADMFPDASINDSVKAYRLVLHADDAFPDFLFTTHGYKAEYYVCTQESNYQDCGIMRVKGQQFFANFRTPFYTDRDLRPGCDANTEDCDFGFGYEFSYLPDADNPNIVGITNDEPYVQLQSPLIRDDGIDWREKLRNSQNITNRISWSSGEIGPCNSSIQYPDGSCRNNYLRFAFQAFDAGVLPDERNLNASPQICFGEEYCAYDNSYKGVFEVGAWVESEWDMIDGVDDDHITGVLWVDRFQQPKADQSSCTGEHLGDTLADDCFKMEFEHYPISPGAATNRRGPGNLTFFLTEYNECLPDKNCKVR